MLVSVHQDVKHIQFNRKIMRHLLNVIFSFDTLGDVLKGKIASCFCVIPYCFTVQDNHLSFDTLFNVFHNFRELFGNIFQPSREEPDLVAFFVDEQAKSVVFEFKGCRFSHHLKGFFHIFCFLAEHDFGGISDG